MAPEEAEAGRALAPPSGHRRFDAEHVCLEAWAEVLARGYEGLASKDAPSPYVAGLTLKWLKVKQLHYREGERGWEPKK